MIYCKRVYAAAEMSDGVRFLVDHLWPRGLSRQAVKVKEWLKAVSPSDKLRTWFGHDPAKWEQFRGRYFGELDHKPGAWRVLLEAAQEGDVTLVFSARDTERNNAVALKSYLEEMLAVGASKGPHNLLAA
jgi:uncharacterized protein YeaO (DUF488 family)